jgi:hypothetical protein
MKIKLLYYNTAATSNIIGVFDEKINIKQILRTFLKEKYSFQKQIYENCFCVAKHLWEDTNNREEYNKLRGENIDEEFYLFLKEYYKKDYLSYKNKTAPNYLTMVMRDIIDIWKNFSIETFEINSIQPFEIYTE